jgi:thiosulfate/3-mercaptopyruvate sulfurtransferase
MTSPLISADAVRTHAFVLLDARQGAAAYAAGHLAGALHADLNSQLSAATVPDADPRRGGRHPLPSIEDWAKQLGAWGIEPGTDVVIYDDADGSNAAARAWWMLRSAGHAAVRVLDGGFHAAVVAGLPVTTEPTTPNPTNPYPVDAWQLPIVDMATVDAVRHDSAWKVLDVRSGPRFRAETEPFDPVPGHIPGAVNLPFADNMRDEHFKTPDELRAQYESLLDGTPVDRLIVHCGSGVTACHTLLALDIAGLQGAALYVGSWSEWCRNDMPIGTGA